MKKIFTFLGLSIGLCVTSVYGDELKNSLTNMLKEKETTPSMINLDNVSLDPKEKPVQKAIKTRPGKTVIATVNGQNIIKKEADTYLKQRTQGKVTDFDLLPRDQRARLIQELALPLIVAGAAKKELSEEEKQAAYTRAWMQREARKVNVTDEKAMELYNQLKKQAQENNTTKLIPPFESIKDRLKIQIIEKTVIDTLMKDAKIKVQ